jgi:hypothetical protein
MLIALMIAVVAVFSMGASRTVNVPCGSNLANVVNNDAKDIGTTFKLGSCTYNTSATIAPRKGDELVGVPGTVSNRPVAGTNPENITSIVNGTNNVDQVIKPKEGPYAQNWVQVQGANFDGSAGSGAGLALGSAGQNTVVRNSRFTNNEAMGVSNANGKFFDVEFDNNGSAAALGFTSSGIKSINVIEVSGGWAHDNEGNGIWGDVRCTPSSTHPNGFWIHNVDVEGNTRGGVRYENCSGGALIEDNYIHGNSTEATRGGVSIRDSQNALVQGNVFDNNAKNLAGIASDSGRSDRVNLSNIDVVNNDFNGETFKGCELPDNIVRCANNQ